MAAEIERKFIVTNLPPIIKEQPKKEIEQGYLALDPEGKEVRLRQANQLYSLTVKTAGGLQRQEYEISLSQTQFEVLWEATQDRRIRKDRYVLQQNNLLIEVDIYHQPLQGLIVAEVEFETVEAANNYQKEPWMGEEVTHLSFLKNKNLLQFENYQALLERLE